MDKNISRKSKDKSPLRSGAWIISLFIQLVALYFLSLLSMHYGNISTALFIVVLIGYVYLAKSTVGMITGKMNDVNAISALTAIHMIALIVSILIIAFMSSFYRINM